MSDKVKNTLLWGLQIFGAISFIVGGGIKLAGNEVAVQMFEMMGGQWFRYLTGCIEVGSGILLLVPQLAGVGALILMCTMVVATGVHVFVIGGTPAPALVVLVVMSIIAYGRRDRTLRLIRRGW